MKSHTLCPTFSSASISHGIHQKSTKQPMLIDLLLMLSKLISLYVKVAPKIASCNIAFCHCENSWRWKKQKG